MKHKIEGSQHRAREEKNWVKNRLSIFKWFQKKKEEPKLPNYQIYRPDRKKQEGKND